MVHKLALTIVLVHNVGLVNPDGQMLPNLLSACNMFDNNGGCSYCLDGIKGPLQVYSNDKNN